VASNNRIFTSFCLTNNGISVHPKITASAPLSISRLLTEYKPPSFYYLGTGQKQENKEKENK